MRLLLQGVCLARDFWLREQIVSVAVCAAETVGEAVWRDVRVLETGRVQWRGAKDPRHEGGTGMFGGFRKLRLAW